MAVPDPDDVEEETGLSSTADVDEVCKRVWDAVVIGAGPGGSMAARELARRGAATLLIDKAAFPRYKVCGGYINPRSVGTLAKLGLGDLLSSLGALPMDTFHLGAAGRSAILPIPGGMSLSRRTLDHALVREAERAGAVFLARTQAYVKALNMDTVCVEITTVKVPRELHARMVIAASGLGGACLREVDGFEAGPKEDSYIGAGAVAPHAPDFYNDHTVYMACGDGGYCGLQRAEDGRLNMAAALSPAIVRKHGDLAGAVQWILGEAGFEPLPGLAALKWKGTRALTRQANRVALRRVLVVGDAAGYVEPFTGEGISWALAGGAVAAEIAANGLKNYTSDVERAWENTYDRMVRRKLWVCRTIAAGLRHPRFVRSAIALLGVAPALACPIIKQLNAVPPLLKVT